MTNEEAVKMLKAKLECMDRQTRGIFEECNPDMCDSCDLNYAQGNMGEQKETLRMAIKALQQVNCEDAISRQAVLDIDFEKIILTTARPAEMIEQKIRALPPVTPQPTRWISVSERLPEESLNSVIGWDAFQEQCVFVQFFHGHFQIVGKAESFDIKAWMPLPEPYKAESEE